MAVGHYEYWTLVGVPPFLGMSDQLLAAVLRTTVVCEGDVLSRGPAALRIKLPEGKHKDFQILSGLKLTGVMDPYLEEKS